MSLGLLVMEKYIFSPDDGARGKIKRSTKRLQFILKGMLSVQQLSKTCGSGGRVRESPTVITFIL